jgi:HSP20 family molecular chaperone IbpA
MTPVSDVYPGQYHPRQESLQKMLHAGDALISRYPYSNILSVDGNYQVQIAIPGVKRENIYIEVTGDHMIVRIFDQQRISEDKQPGKRMKILRKCFIKLPDDADANFATAKINNNLLTIELAKKDKWTKNIPGNLIPY